LQAQAEGRRLEREIVAISEKERQTIGADLHDGLGQQLTAIELICAGLKDDVAELRPDIRKRLDQVGKMLREAVGQTRILARDLVPINNDSDALPVALAQLAERISSSGNILCHFRHSEGLQIEDPTTAGHLYRIAQEAVNNAIKHGHATKIEVFLGRQGGDQCLRIVDNGGGIRKTVDRDRGIGLRVMHHRANIIGATLEIASARGSGVTVTCIISKKT
jgi:signal transduction histidine kinase